MTKFKLLESVSPRSMYVRNCNLMLEHALNKGLKVPASVTQVIDRFNRNPNETTVVVQAMPQGMPKKLELPTPVNLPELIPASSLEPLVKAHDRLAELIAPVTPRSLLFVNEETANQSPWAMISPIKFIRQMVMAAMFCLLAFILLGMLRWVSFTSSNEVYDYYGIELLSNLLFYMSAAGLGASFAALFSSNEYIEQGTFDPKYKSSYWIRFLLGLVAGMILALLIPLDNSGTKLIENIGKPTLAMIGGFSASLVYRILNGLLEAVEILFGRQPKEVKKTQEALDKVKSELSTQGERYLRQLSELSKVIHESDASSLVKNKIDAILDDNLPPFNEQAERKSDFENEFSDFEAQYRSQEYDFYKAKGAPEDGVG